MDYNHLNYEQLEKLDPKMLEIMLEIYKPVYDIYFRYIGMKIGFFMFLVIIIYLYIVEPTGKQLHSLQGLGFAIIVGMLIMAYHKTENIMK